jgi:hypothetical protein
MIDWITHEDSASTMTIKNEGQPELSARIHHADCRWWIRINTGPLLVHCKSKRLAKRRAEAILRAIQGEE